MFAVVSDLPDRAQTQRSLPSSAPLHWKIGACGGIHGGVVGKKWQKWLGMGILSGGETGVSVNPD